MLVRCDTGSEPGRYRVGDFSTKSVRYRTVSLRYWFIDFSTGSVRSNFEKGEEVKRPPPLCAEGCCQGLDPTAPSVLLPPMPTPAYTFRENTIPPPGLGLLPRR
ncbi:hypothetical protein EOD39_17369 [Acipenser ruthenus]|uniref:Uncharacterized protein n=1 Tax=Acipenser ruthenus TaxID=7906 RepID=A0A444V3L9_ACIRT|nr:hypothetical protein EOD39_17369 [Acipenser ruthenus]